MTIQDIKDFDMEWFHSKERFKEFKNQTFEQFIEHEDTMLWFYFSMVLIRENVLKLNEQGLITDEIIHKIFGDNSEIFIEKFPNMYPEQKK